MTQQQLADEIGVTRQTISQYEAEAIQPTKAKLDRLASALGVSVGKLYADVQENLTFVKEPYGKDAGDEDPWKVIKHLIRQAERDEETIKQLRSENEKLKNELSRKE